LKLDFSFIIPVYNRPLEIDELLKSISKQKRDVDFEVIIIEDGSQVKSDEIVKDYKIFLNIIYLYKENSGPGDSRNYGVKKAKGDYIIFLDSDSILPNDYLQVVSLVLKNNSTDAYGGPDKAHHSFTDWQKAISYSMTSILTTGGIRGSEKVRNKFQLRSFNMGVSRKAFLRIKGFSKQRFGEDIDLTFRLWEGGFTTQFISKAFVYHKRRATLLQFFKQTFNFGAARPILNSMHPNSSKITFWFPSLFLFGILITILGWYLNSQILAIIYAIYFLVIYVDSLIKSRNPIVATLSIFTTITQFLGYGLGFIRSMFRLKILKKSPEQTFPKMFE
jgi:glycosyltransferase involved in cell wall biosynthesis